MPASFMDSPYGNPTDMQSCVMMLDFNVSLDVYCSAKIALVIHPFKAGLI